MNKLRTMIREWGPIKNYRAKRQLYGEPSRVLALPFWFVWDRMRYGRFAPYITRARTIQGWIRGPELIALIHASASLDPNPVIVEIGSFMGCSTVLLAGGRQLQGSGIVHCVDPFDASGDEFSTPIYHDIRHNNPMTLRQQFEHNIKKAGLSDYVVVHQCLGHEAAQDWQQPIDLLFSDGEFSEEGARRIYESWLPHLKPGGILMLHNSTAESADHRGNTILARKHVRPPHFDAIQLFGSTTFARKRREISKGLYKSPLGMFCLFLWQIGEIYSV